MTDSPEALRIIEVRLLDGSLKTVRELAGDHRATYPVGVRFSRPANAYERRAIQEEIDDLVFDEENPSYARKLDTTLEAIDGELDLIHDSIENAVANAHSDRQDAEREDARLVALEEALNSRLQKLANR